jgi:hypothetical protein
MSLIQNLRNALGSAWHVNSEGFFSNLLPVADGTPEASKVITTDANTNVALLNVTTLKIGGVQQSQLPDAQYSTAALQAAVMPAANIAGAKVVAFENTGTTPGTLTTDTAANIVAAIPGALVGQAYLLKIRNSSGSANTATIAGGTGVTMHGTLTIAQNVTRDFMVVLTSLTAIDMYSMGVSAAGA